MNFFAKLLSFLIALMFFLRSSIFAVYSWIGLLYYIVLIVFTVYSLIALLIGNKNYKLDGSLFCFLIVGLFSVLMNDINPFFQPYQRFFAFVMVAVSFGPLLQTNINIQIKLHTLSFIKKIGIPFTIITLFMELSNISAPISLAFSFGLAYHDMTMAPIAFITAFFVFDDLWKHAGKRYKNIIYFVLCSACGVLTGSRGALGGFLLGIIVYIMQIKRGSKKVLYLCAIGLISVLVYITNPYGILDHFFEKMDRDSEDISSVTSGRDKMVLDRIEDFKSSPIIGVGFGTMKNISHSKVNFEKGTIESGSSWFLILGSMGFLGVLFYIMCIINNLKPPIRKGENIVLSSCVCFFLVHSLVEGYIISFGAPLCAIFWLFLGVLRSRVEYNK